MMRVIFRAVSGVAAALFLASGLAAQDRPSVFTVNYPLQYFAERLLADAGEVVLPVPVGTDPSFWRPSIADISAFQSADLILLNGAGFAPWVDRVSLPRSKTVNTAVGLEDRFIATDSITHSHGDGGEHSHEGTASYLWLDPALAILQAEAIASAIVAKGLAPEAVVEPRLDALRADLQEMDSSARDGLATAQGRVLIATHPRFQYLARAYGLTILSLEWDAGAAPTEEELADLRALVEEHDAGLLIWEAAPPADALAQVAEEVGVTSVVFPPLAQPAQGADFLESLRASHRALATALSAGN